MVPKRGLLDTNQQVFEIFSSLEFRVAFDKIYDIVVANQFSKHAPFNLKESQAKHVVKGASETSIKAYMTINKFLCSLLEKNLKEFPYYIKEKNYFEQLLGVSPDTTQGMVFFPNDAGVSNVLLKGIEWHLLIMYMALFGFTDLMINSALKAGLVVYVVDLVVRAIRYHFGRNNLSRKALLDKKFLL